MTINPFQISELITGISCLALGFFVYSRDPNNKLYRKWLFLKIAISIWGFGGFVITLFGSRNPDLVLWLWRLTYGFGVMWIPILYLEFVSELCGLKSRKLLIFAFAVNLIIFPLVFTDIVFPSVYYAFESFYYASANNLIFLMYYIWWCFVFTYTLFKLHRFMEASEGPRRNQIKHLFVGCLFGAIGGSLNFMPFFKINIYPWGNFAVPIYAAWVSYAIVVHRLMDINVVLRKTLVFSLFTFLVSIVYLLFLSIFYGLFFASKVPESSVPLVILSVIFIGLLLKPLEMIFQRLVERRFFQGTISEISAQKAMLESELERSERLKSVGILAAGMAHEIKNPLTAIKTFAEYLPQKHQDPEFREKFSRIITQETDRIRRILTDLLMFSKPSEPIRQQCYVNQILIDILDLMNSELTKRGVSVARQLDAKNAVYVDPNQIKQAFLNILINSLDAMENQSGHLLVKTVDASECVEVMISDSGCGIPKDRLNHIFDPFFTDKERGTGLGLAITYSIINKNKGSITADSQPGVGSTFRVLLPIAN